MTPAAVPSPAPPPVAPLSTAAEIADAFDLLAFAAHWLEADEQLGLFEVPCDPAETERRAEQARAELARLQPPLLLAGIAAWVERQQRRTDLGVDVARAAKAAAAASLPWSPGGAR